MSCCPELASTNFEDVTNALVKARGGAPHIVAGARECEGGEGANPIIGIRAREGPISDVGAVALEVGRDG
jgi:hypothetical protein